MIHILTALPCEAKPLIQNLMLRPESAPGRFRRYVSPQGDISLTLSGPGIVNAATAVADTRHRYPPDRGMVHGWLNVGIAGHRDHALGKAFLVAGLHAPEGTRSDFPQFAFNPPLPLASLQTSVSACTDYVACQDRLTDMEGSGFYAMASRFSPVECVHCIKIVSDNAVSGIERICSRQVGMWIEQHWCDIACCLETMQCLCDTLSTPLPRSYVVFMHHAHFTVSQREQLRSLLLRWQALMPEQAPDHLIEPRDGARHLLKKLAGRLAQRVLQLP